MLGINEKINKVFDFLFPCFTCLVCGTEINESKNKYICDTCADKIPYHGKVCDKCGRKVSEHAFICDFCKNTNRTFDKARAAFIYKDEICNLILRLKYNSEGDIAKAVAPFLAKCYTENFSTNPVDIIIPVPLTPRRMKARGYNQALLIADELSKIIDIPVEEYALVRIKKTVAQVDMTLKERKSNLQGAFSVVNPSLVKGKNILLVDDVFTTGSTCEECSRVLKKAGALKVFVLSIANVELILREENKY